MEATKIQVIRKSLEFLSRFAPIGQARVADLGGEGLEARVWAENNIPSGNGYLVEQNRKKAGKLILRYRYQFQDRLANFAGTLISRYGEQGAWLDFFHLDLCGTLCKSSISDFTPVALLVLKGTGRCLAITLADMRYNAALKYWDKFFARGAEMFGPGNTKLYEALLKQQQALPVTKQGARPAPFKINPFDPVKGARREFGALVELVGLFRNQPLPWLPIAMERYVYVSRTYGKRPFRMRTYFLHFGDQVQENPELAFAQAWVNSKMFYANRDPFAEVAIVPVSLKQPGIPIRKRRIETVMAQGQKQTLLGGLAEYLGGEYLTEFNKMREQAELGERIMAAFPPGMLNIGSPTKDSSKSQNGGSTLPTGKPNTKVQRRKWDDFTGCEQVEFILKALELRASFDGKFLGSEALAAWEKLLKQNFGYYNPKLGKSMRSALARTKGERFRPEFEERIRKACGDKAQPYLDRLAKL